METIEQIENKIKELEEQKRRASAEIFTEALKGMSITRNNDGEVVSFEAYTVFDESDEFRGIRDKGFSAIILHSMPNNCFTKKVKITFMAE